MKLFSTSKDSSSEPFTSARKLREYKNEWQIERVLETAHSENWRNNILALLVTAGPITYLGLQLGYYFGYGTFAPLEIFIYFAIFTVVAGLLGIIVRIIDHATTKQKQAESQAQLRRVLNGLPNLIFALKNARLSRQEPEDRRFDATLEILKSAHTEIGALRRAVLHITQDRDLAEIAAEIEVFRRAGLNVYVGDIIKANAQAINAATEQIEQTRPDVGFWLASRFSAHAPSLKEGLVRSEGFIERVLAWMDTQSNDLLRSRDFEEVVTLMFELMCSREIPMLSIRFQGDESVRNAAHRLERARHSYRIALSARFSRLKALSRALDLNLQDQHLRDAQETLKNIDYALEGRITLLDRTSSKRPNVIREQISELETFFSLYRELIVSNKRVRSREESLQRALKHWQQVAARYEFAFSQSKKTNSVWIIRRQVRLNDREKLEVADRLAKFFPSHENPLFWSPETKEKVIIEIMQALMDSIFVSQADRQRAIETSNAPNLSWIEPGFSASAKSNYGINAVAEVRDDLSHTSERLFRALITQYNVIPDEDMVDFFVTKYGAREQILHHMAENLKAGVAMPSLTDPERLKLTPKIRKNWQETFEKAKKQVKVKI